MRSSIASERTSRANPLKVLIVEDNLLAAMDLEMQVEDAGHEVVGTAVDLAFCRMAADAASPDVALMDLRLKRSDSGEEAARWLRETYDVPCIFVSRNVDEATRERLSELAPAAFVGKPVLPSRLVDALAEAADRLAPATNEPDVTNELGA